jgi:hypothetical protein
MQNSRSNRRYFSARPSLLIAPRLKIDLCTLRQEHPPCGFKIGAGSVESLRRAAGVTREYGDISFQAIRTRNPIVWHNDWLGDNKVAMSHALISRLRVVFRFGAVMLEDRQCDRLLNIPREMRFERTQPRDETVSSDQVRAIRVKAHRRGWPSIALVQSLQFEASLSQKGRNRGSVRPVRPACRRWMPAYIGPMAVSSPDLKAFLLATPFFGGLSDASLDLLVSMLAERRFDAGALVFAEGEQGRSMFVVHSGRLVVNRRAEFGGTLRIPTSMPMSWCCRTSTASFAGGSAAPTIALPSSRCFTRARDAFSSALARRKLPAWAPCRRGAATSRC